MLKLLYSHGTKIHVEPSPGGGRKAGNKHKFNGCTYIASGLGFLRSWIIEPHFNDHSLHGRLNDITEKEKKRKRNQFSLMKFLLQIVRLVF